MTTAATRRIQAGGAPPPEAAGQPRAQACAADDPGLGASGGLSNDFLNHYSEVLMLIEMAPHDPDIAADLNDWQPMSYPAYFSASPLRRAATALAAYDALPPARRQAFEQLTGAMDTLATMAAFALQPPCDSETAMRVCETTVPALRNLVERAAAFLNSGGRELPEEGEGERAQALIDRLIERGGAPA
jgi:hypothetical protein